MYTDQNPSVEWKIRALRVSGREDPEMFTLRGAFTVLAALCVFSLAGPAAERPSVMGRNAGALQSRAHVV